MNKAKKAVLVGVGVVTIGAAGLGAATSFATDGANGGRDTLVQALATKFNVDKSEVEKVFKEQHTAHHEQMKTEREAALKKALTDKKITQEQYDHIVAAWAKIDSAMEAGGGRDTQTTAQRNAVKTEMDALRDWMKSQNLSPETLGMKRPEGRGHGPDGEPGVRQSTAQSSTTNQ